MIDSVASSFTYTVVYIIYAIVCFRFAAFLLLLIKPWLGWSQGREYVLPTNKAGRPVNQPASWPQALPWLLVLVMCVKDDQQLRLYPIFDYIPD